MNAIDEVMEVVRERLKKFRALYEQNEMAVREQIINPILRNLGWDPEEPEYVQPNITLGDGIPDYALMVDGKPFLFIEAKKLSVDIKNRDSMRQLSRYSVEKGTRYGLLTNGYTWLLLRTFEEGKDIGERTIWEVDIENEDNAAVRRKMLYLTRDKIRNLETLVKKAHIIDEVWNQYIMSNPGLLASALINIVKDRIAEGYKDVQFEESEIKDLLDEKVLGLIVEDSNDESIHNDFDDLETEQLQTSYTKMIVGNQSFSLQNAFEILVNTANWLVRQGKLRKSDCPISISRGKRYLVNTIPKHRYDEPFRAPRELTNGLFVETHASTVSIIDYSRRLLEKFGYSKDMLRVMH